MRNLVLVAVLLCCSLVAQAYPVVDVFLDVSDLDNVTITSYETRGEYGDFNDVGYFALDALQVFGDLVDGSGYDLGMPDDSDPSYLRLAVSVADGNELTAFNSNALWLENGFEYTFPNNYFASSDPSDYCAFADGSYAGYFLIVDAGDPTHLSGINGLGDGSGKLLGQIIPEPATLAMLAIGATAVIRRRR